MKKLNSIALSLAVPAIAFSGLVVAGGPGSNKPAKAKILHCGCSVDGDRLVMIELDVRHKARGHDQHTPGDYVTCETLSGYNSEYRSKYDCQISGPTVTGLDLCTSMGYGYTVGHDCD